jgi:hypothetical protein
MQGQDSDVYDDNDCVIADDGRSGFLITIKHLFSRFPAFPERAGGKICVWVDVITILDPSWLVTMHDDCVLKALYENQDSGNNRSTHCLLT